MATEVEQQTEGKHESVPSVRFLLISPERHYSGDVLTRLVKDPSSSTLRWIVEAREEDCKRTIKLNVAESMLVSIAGSGKWLVLISAPVHHTVALHGSPLSWQCLTRSEKHTSDETDYGDLVVGSCSDRTFFSALAAVLPKWFEERFCCGWSVYEPKERAKSSLLDMECAAVVVEKGLPEACSECKAFLESDY